MKYRIRLAILEQKNHLQDIFCFLLPFSFSRDPRPRAPPGRVRTAYELQYTNYQINNTLRHAHDDRSAFGIRHSASAGSAGDISIPAPATFARLHARILMQGFVE